MPKPITGIIIEPDGSTHAFQASSLRRLKALQSAVGGYIQVIASTKGDMYINEEGKLQDLAVNPRATNLLKRWGWKMSPDCIVGPAVVLGPCDEDGEPTSIPDAVVLEIELLCPR